MNRRPGAPAGGQGRVAAARGAPGARPGRGGAGRGERRAYPFPKMFYTQAMQDEAVRPAPVPTRGSEAACEG